MNNKLLVRLSNSIGIVSIILLVYWVFIFISITVFRLRVFKENITETFYLSVVGIIALMSGALITNIMFNLTRIAEKHNRDEINVLKSTSKKATLLFGLSFPLILGILFAGDYITSSRKEKMLISSARSIIESSPEKTDKLLNYTFSEEWIIETTDILDLYSKTDKYFPFVSVIIADSIDKSDLFLGFANYGKHPGDTLKPQKKDFIQPTTKEERDYLNSVFHGNTDKIKFSTYDGRYELFYPYFRNGRKIVLYFSEYQRYGKIGS